MSVLDFNSRPREGANLQHHSENLGDRISIPAPARGRTYGLTRRECISCNFNSRPREGANGLHFLPHLHANGFQFPPPRGGERGIPMYYINTQDFNSRPREGANCKTAQNRAVYLVSLLKFGRISAILPYILSATRAKKRETPKIIGFLLRRPTGRSCMEQVGAGGVR